jgi:hypothetical protein
MDILVSSAYLCSMLARLITMFAILAITVVTTVTPAHAARMSVEPDHSMHVGEMTHASVSSELSCDGDRHCGSADAEMCEFVCAGLSAFLTSPGGDAGQQHESVSHDFPSEAGHVSRAPGLNERPPRLRLL